MLRRQALRFAMHGLAVGPMAAMLAACSDDDGGSSSAGTRAGAGSTSTTAWTPESTVPPRADGKWWLSGNYAPVADEVEATDLEVIEGALPRDLDGLYVRNGSNPPSGDSTHWFFGDGMVHGIALSGGRATWYRNRYVQTALYTSHAGPGAPGGANNQSNVSVIHHAGRLLTSGEVGLPYELRLDDLSTVGPFDFAGRLTGSFTAHPKIDPTTGLLHSFGYGFAPPYLTYHVTGRDGRMAHVEPVELRAATMVHDFAITEQDVVIWELPVLFDMDAAIRWVSDPASGAQPFAWRPEHGGRIGVMPLGGPASEIRWFPIDPCYVYHSVNAYRDGERVVLDVCRLSKTFDAADQPDGELSLRRWTIDLERGRVTDDVLVEDDPGELPSRDPRRVGRRHRHGYLVQTSTAPDGSPRFGGLIKHDYDRDRRDVWRPHAAEHTGEWLFVPGGSDEADDAGYLLSYLYDERDGAGQLVVVDATDVAAGPIARVALPQRVPFGFHGTWVPSGGE